MRVGVSMLDAVEQTSNFRAGGRSVETSVSSEPAVPSEAALARQNEAALRELGSMMGGLGT
jgi:hypothetical protein